MDDLEDHPEYAAYLSLSSTTFEHNSHALCVHPMTDIPGNGPTPFEPGLLSRPVMRALPELRELLILAEHVTNAGWEWARVEVLAELPHENESFPATRLSVRSDQPILAGAGGIRRCPRP